MQEVNRRMQCDTKPVSFQSPRVLYSGRITPSSSCEYVLQTHPNKVWSTQRMWLLSGKKKKKQEKNPHKQTKTWKNKQTNNKKTQPVRNRLFERSCSVSLLQRNVEFYLQPYISLLWKNMVQYMKYFKLARQDVWPWILRVRLTHTAI